MDSQSSCIHKAREGCILCRFFPKSGNGFTLIEMLVATGIAIALFAAGLILTMSDYRAGSFNREVETLVVLLQTARSNAMSNIGEAAYGVAITPPDHPRSYVLFRGASYAESTLVVAVGQEYAIDREAGSADEIVFSQLSGDVRIPGTITFLDREREVSRSISINEGGRISW
ncbi:MAG TPA: type II secretion system protein [Candidatus Paceibacterota bacterium]